MGLLAWIAKQRQWRKDHVDAFNAVSEKHSDGLTLFQHHALAALDPIVPPSAFRRVLVADDPNDYLVAPLANCPLKVYVYSNEAAISGPNDKPWLIFEEWAFRTPGDLISALKEEVVARAA